MVTRFLAPQDDTRFTFEPGQWVDLWVRIPFILMLLCHALGRFTSLFSPIRLTCDAAAC